jgi:hypothetical protein
MISRLKVIALALIALTFTPTAAQALDIPLLTWERSREQQVVFGVGTFPQYWQVQLEGENIDPIAFQQSQSNKSGFVVFTISLDSAFELGSYSIVATGKKGEKKVIAGVQVIEATTKTGATSLFDLTTLVAIFVFITALISALRSRKYSDVSFRSTQNFDDISLAIRDPQENFWDRLEAAPYLARINAIHSMRVSLPRFLIIREGELAHRLSKSVYAASPLVGLIAGVYVSSNLNHNGGLVNISLFTLVALVAFSIWDALSGIAVVLGFWAVQLLTGHVTSVRDLLLQISLGIALVGPSLFASVLRDVIHRDFKPKDIYGRDPIKFFGVVGSALVGTLIFYFGYSLITSLLYIEGAIRHLSFVQVSIVTLALLIRGFAEGVYLEARSDRPDRVEHFYIARVTSPATAVAVFALVFAFVYIWTEKSTSAVLAAAIFAIPYLIGFIRFNSWVKTQMKWGRNVLLESALASAVIFIIFRELAHKPILLDQRVTALLILSGIPAVIHAVYSAVYASNEETFISDEIHGRIEK